MKTWTSSEICEKKLINNYAFSTDAGMPVGNLQTWCRQVEKILREGGGALPEEHPAGTELLCRSGEGRGGDVY